MGVMSTVIGNYLTVSELAEEMDVTVQRAHQLILKYEIPTFKPHARLTLIEKKDAAKLVKMQRPTGVHIDRR